MDDRLMQIVDRLLASDDDAEVAIGEFLDENAETGEQARDLLVRLKSVAQTTITDVEQHALGH